MADVAKVRSQYAGYFVISIVSSIIAGLVIFGADGVQIWAKLAVVLPCLALGTFACAKLLVMAQTYPNLLEDETTP